MSKKTLIATAVGSAFVASMATAPIASAAENPFAMQPLDQGYMVAQAGKMGDGKCGQGKCGGMKAGEAKCGMSMMDADKDGKISKNEFIKGHEAMFVNMDANKDGFLDKTEMANMMQGKCGATKNDAKATDMKPADKKMPEGKCGEGKCGATKKPVADKPVAK